MAEAARSGPANDHLDQRSIEVGALSKEECLELCATRLSCDIESLREEVGDLFVGTQGNPYFLEQVIEGFDPRTGKLQALSLDEVVDRRLGRLHAVAKPLLEAIAVAGEAVSLTEAAKIANVSEGILTTITHMRSEQLVRFVGSEAQQLVDTYHDKIRETTLDQIPAARRRALHRQYGEWLEAAENIHADEVIDFLRRAEQCEPPDLPNSIRYRMYQRLASSHARLRMLPRALELYDEALPFAPSSFARGHLRRQGLRECNIGETFRVRRELPIVARRVGRPSPLGTGRRSANMLHGFSGYLSAAWAMG